MDILGYFNVKKPDVVHETIDGETVIVNLESGVYYSLRYSGVDVWNLIEKGVNYEEIIVELTRLYAGEPAKIETAVRDLIIQMQQEGLLQVSSKRHGAVMAPQLIMSTGAEKPGFELPVLERYSDMQELLLLDPIHEVDEEEWPLEEDSENAGADRG